MADKLKAWVNRLRSRLAAFLRELVTEADGTIIQSRVGAIDDGVNYAMPLVIPDGADDTLKAAIVQAAVREAGQAFHFQMDRPYSNFEAASLFPTANPLLEWTHATRKEVIARCHLAWERNPLANTAVGLTTLFSVGEGFTLTYRNELVEDILEEFRSNPDNGLQEYEKTFAETLQVDGELFVRFHKGEDGATIITPIPAWEIDYIKTELGFSKRVIAYHRSGMQSDGTPGSAEYIDEEIPAEEVIHVSINKLAYDKRGRPELFRIMPWLKAYKDWLENRARQNHWRGSLLWDVTLEGALPNQVAAKRAQYRQPPSPGSMVVHNEKEKWQPMENKASSGDVAEDGRQIKIMAAVGAKLPEYMLSDGENSNLASARSQQLPALRKFVDFQDILLRQVWAAIYTRVLENAIAAGRLPEEVPEQDSDGDPLTDKDGAVRMIETLEAYDLSGPEIETTDPKTLAEALQIAVNSGWVSDETAAQSAGYDYYMEQKKIRREKEQRQADAAAGLGGAPVTPPPAGFQAGPDGAEQAPAPGQIPDTMPTPAAESLRAMVEAMSMPGDASAQPMAGGDAPGIMPMDGEGMLHLRFPQPIINVAAPNVTFTAPAQPAPIVNVTTPEVTVNVPEQAAPVVNVAAPKLTAPNVTVTPPAEGPEVMTVERDADGRIIRVIKNKEQ